MEGEVAKLFIGKYCTIRIGGMKLYAFVQGVTEETIICKTDRVSAHPLDRVTDILEMNQENEQIFIEKYGKYSSD